MVAGSEVAQGRGAGQRGRYPRVRCWITQEGAAAHVLNTTRAVPLVEEFVEHGAALFLVEFCALTEDAICLLDKG